MDINQGSRHPHFLSDQIKKLTQEVAKELKQHNHHLAVAESCTGGGLSYHLTALPGSSDWFECGFVTYSNASKIALLEVSAETLDKAGAVSAEVARAMADGVLKNSQAQFSIAITGIAGPTGGSAEKPVGTVWFGFARPHGKTLTHLENFSGDRESIRLAAIQTALQKLLDIVKQSY